MKILGTQISKGRYGQVKVAEDAYIMTRRMN